MAEELPATISLDLLTLLGSGKVRELNDIVDLAAEVGAAIVRKEMSTGAARELRQWAELMYTCVQAQQSGGDGDVNYISQLVQVAGGQPIINGEPARAIETASKEAEYIDISSNK